jgi:hypothetical protein
MNKVQFKGSPSESCTSVGYIHPSVVKKIYNLCKKNKEISLQKLKKQFCPNISKYENKTLVRLFYMFDSGVMFVSNELILNSDFKTIDWNKKINLGIINVDNKNTYLSLNDLIAGAYDDPYIIYNFIDTHGDLMVDNGYLAKNLNNITIDEDEFSEEISDEETDEETDTDSNDDISSD